MKTVRSGVLWRGVDDQIYFALVRKSLEDCCPYSMSLGDNVILKIMRNIFARLYYFFNNSHYFKFILFHLSFNFLRLTFMP